MQDDGETDNAEDVATRASPRLGLIGVHRLPAYLVVAITTTRPFLPGRARHTARFLAARTRGFVRSSWLLVDFGGVRAVGWQQTGTLGLECRSTAGGRQLADKQHRPYRHSIHAVMGVLAGQWVTAVLASLVAGRRTYTELRDDINEHEARWDWVAHSRPLTQKVLTETLARMQRDGLLTKSDRSGTFGKTWYELTPEGRLLLHALQPLAKWGEVHRSEARDTQAQ